MRLVTYDEGAGPHAGVLLADEIVPVATLDASADTVRGLLVTLDDAGDLQNLGLRTRINGEVVQEGTTADQIFGVAETVAWLSRTLTLAPGDIIATGTPAGIGATKDVFLRAGDSVEVEVVGLGAVRNNVRAA